MFDQPLVRLDGVERSSQFQLPKVQEAGEIFYFVISDGAGVLPGK